MMSLWRPLIFLICFLIVTIFQMCSCQSSTNGDEHTFASLDEIRNARVFCSSEYKKWKLTPAPKPKYKSPAICKALWTLKFTSLTTSEAVQHLLDANGNTWLLRQLMHETKGINEEVLREAVKAVKDHKPDLRVLQVINGMFIKRLGGIKQLTVADIDAIGIQLVPYLPSSFLKDTTDEILDLILDTIEDNTANNGDPELQVHYLQKSSRSFFQALCRRTFTKYNQITSPEAFRRTKFLLFCAPVEVCKTVDADLARAHIEDFTRIPFGCRMGLKYLKHGWTVGMYQSYKACAKILTEKLLNEGSNRLDLSVESDVLSLQDRFLCMSLEKQIEASAAINCSIISKTLEDGFLSQRVAKYTTARCLNLPEEPSDVKCSHLLSIVGYINDLAPIYFRKIPWPEKCQDECIKMFSATRSVDFARRKWVIRKCMHGKQIHLLSSSIARQLQGMIAVLPGEQLKQLAAADIAPYITDIKRTLTREMVKDPQKRAMVKQLSVKMQDSGGFKDLADAADFMEQVSLHRLKGSVTNIMKDLGLSEGINPSLTPFQNKWAASELLRGRGISSVSVEEIREMKSVVKGFSTIHIARLNPLLKIEMAVALCEQTGWELHLLGAINHYLIRRGLEMRNKTDSMKQLSVVDVDAIGCECLMHFKPNELRQMNSDVCVDVCYSVGSCDKFRCMLDEHRKEYLEACIACLGKAASGFLTEADVTTLGPNLLVEMSASEFMTKMPNEVLKKKQSMFQRACMKKSFFDGMKTKLSAALGGNPGAWDAETLISLGRNIIFLSKSDLGAIDKAVLDSVAQDVAKVVRGSTEEEEKGLKECCERNLDAIDKSEIAAMEMNVIMALKEAIMWRIFGARKRREVATWTCSDIQILGEGFTVTVTIEELKAIEPEEFMECLSFMGALPGWNSSMLTELLTITEQLYSDVCSLSEDVVLSLGYIALAIAPEDINCLPMNSSSVVSSLGALSKWSDEQLAALASAYLSASDLDSLSNLNTSDVSSLNSIMCGFTNDQIRGISSTVTVESGVQLGMLSSCSLEKLNEFKKLAVDPSAYGPISAWGASEVNELGLIITAISAEEITSLNSSALEGLTAEIITHFPPSVLKMMSNEQLSSLSETQAAALTADQRAALSSDQISLLEEEETFEEYDVPEYYDTPEEDDYESEEEPEEEKPSGALGLAACSFSIILAVVGKIYLY